jgi:hypothetical protein
MTVNKPATLSVMLATISMCAQAAHAGYVIDIKTSDVDVVMKDKALSLLTNHQPMEMLKDSFYGLAKGMKQDGKLIDIDPNMLVASTEDSTDSAVGTCYTNCYGNCYVNCHGTRGWR